MKENLKSIVKNLVNFFDKKTKDLSLMSRKQELSYIKSSVADLILRSRPNGGCLSVSEICEVLKYIESEVEQNILDKKQQAIELLEEIQSNTDI
jgi:hypothetical protein